MNDFVGDFICNPLFDGLRNRLCKTISQVNRITVGSMFTGFGVLEMCLSSLQEQWNQAMPENMRFEVGCGRMWVWWGVKSKLGQNKLDETKCT